MGQKLNALQKTFLALDNMDRAKVLSLLKEIPDLENIKIGLELFCKYGPDFINEIKTLLGPRKISIFLDLKLHDIPQTVSKSIQSLKGLPVDFLTIHISGGFHMMEEAKKSAIQNLPNCKILGVSILTSLDPQDIKQLWGVDPVNFQATFKNLAGLAMDAGLDGMILSPLELSLLKEIKLLKNNSQFLAVTPGVRFPDELSDNTKKMEDQKRTSTFADAFYQGAHYVVIGRPLTSVEQEIQKRRIQSLKFFELP